MSVDRPSRFVVAWAFGPRTAALAEAVVPITRPRTAGGAGIAWVSAGWEPYAAPVCDAACDPVGEPGEPLPIGAGTCVVLRRTPGVRWTQAIKHRRGRRLTHVEVHATIGPAVDQPHTVHSERFTGVLRDRLAGLTRTTQAAASDTATWDAALGLTIFACTWLRPHPALRRRLTAPDPAGRRSERRTPAMALGLADHAWSFVEFLTRPVPHHERECLPKRSYALWLYYHRLDADLLAKALVNYVEPKLRREEIELERLEAERGHLGATGGAARKAAQAVERQHGLLAELREFRDALERVTKLGLRPDLDDGVALNIAPLWEVVPWKYAKEMWQALTSGKYGWSSIGAQLQAKGVAARG